MRYYIEAFDDFGRPVLGNLDGQKALGELVEPTRSAMWKLLKHYSQTNPDKLRRMFRRARLWHLVNHGGTVIGRVDIRNS